MSILILFWLWSWLLSEWRKATKPSTKAAFHLDKQEGSTHFNGPHGPMACCSTAVVHWKYIKTSCCLKPPPKGPRCFYIIVCTSFHDRAANFSSTTGLRIICYHAELQWATNSRSEMISRRSGFIFCANFAQKISLIHHIHRWRTKRNSTAEKSQDINNDTELYLWSCANDGYYLSVLAPAL